MRFPVVAAAAALSTFGAPRIAAADCTPSRAMIVLDKSSSMVTGTIEGTPKWDIAVSALTTIAGTYENSIELGLMVFPNPDECAPGTVQVDTALGARDAIVAQLAAPPPNAGNWTPMAQTLEAAAAVPSLGDPTRNRYVVLITDGWQWCYPYDPATRFTPVDAVVALRAMGVTTYVVGFGAAVDALALNQMAVEGGTAPAGCDPTGATPDATAPCYYRADDPEDLVMALDSIALQLSAETCDGVDNDCDGTVDEDLLRDCTTACGNGIESCAAGAWIGCSAPPVAAETCDGVDNDCDGTTDPGCACAAGESRSCGETDEGTCAIGAQTCDGSGRWGDCVGAVAPAPETCDGADNDCDGATDESDGDDLCPGAFVCRDGTCVDPGAGDPTPDDPGLAEADATACDCRAGGRGASPVAAFLLALALVALRRRS